MVVCVCGGGGARKRKQVVSVVEQQNSIFSLGLSLHRCFIQAPWQGHSKKCSSPTQFSPFVRWRREAQPTVYCSSTPPSSNPRPHVSRRNNWGGPCPELGRCGRSTEWAVNPVPLNPLGGWSSSLPSPCLSHTHALSSPPLLSAISSSTRPGLMLLPGLCDVAIGGPERKPDMGFSAGLVGPEETRSTGGGGGRSGPRGACQWLGGS